MTMTAQIPDVLQRQQALDVSQSFIVQAPAGSGKTELLTQRFLALLAKVQQPEEILALTFTRKAASEMRHRILSTLNIALATPMPNTPHEQRSWQLAQAVLLRDEQCQWQLLKNPSRLKVQTMDALCARLTNAMPILGQLGGQSEIIEDPKEVYAQAAENFLGYLEDENLSQPLSILLQYCDNQLERVKQLLVELLANREQWLSKVLVADPMALREILEEHWQYLIEENLAHNEGSLSALTELMPFVDFVTQFLPLDHPLQLLKDKPLPGFACEDLDAWKVLIKWLLTEDQEWRKVVTIKQGFPPASSTNHPEEKSQYDWMKKTFLTHLEALKQQPNLLQTLQHVLRLPPARYTDAQWEMLSSLMMLLPILVAELTLCFKQIGKVDFTAVSQAAFVALGDAENPTDLALSLDYRLQHLLVDEFQDTSISQLRLLEKLTAGWQVDDGRTLFLVGDPMQSIYRFRQAEVSLFLQVQRQGLGDVSLMPLQLRANFRSTQKIIEWVNQTFAEVMPAENDLAQGAICYASSQAMKIGDEHSFVTWHGIAKDHDEESVMVEQILKLRQQHPNYSIAILVRARSHARPIIDALKQHEIPYQAVDIDYLANTAVINDLFALTKALLHLSDRTAWLSVLRSPLIGLSLSELITLTEEDSSQLIWQQLQQHMITSTISPRLQQVVPILAQCLDQRQRWSLRQCVEDAWYALGGPAIYGEEGVLAVDTYIDLLAKEESDLCIHRLERRLHQLYATPRATGENPVQLMTIHKSKGLEFDVVMIPGLAKPPPKSSRALLDWVELTTPLGPQWFMAPIKAFELEREPMSDFIRYQQQLKEEHELTRVLYVAATRAKQQLHWFTTLETEDESGLKSPVAGSLLAKLWPVVSPTLAQITLAVGERDEREVFSSVVQRLPAEWQLPSEIQWQMSQITGDVTQQNSFQWQPQAARAVGTVIHRCLQTWAAEGISSFSEASLKSLLLLQGCSGILLPKALMAVKEALARVQQDPIGQWILSPHREAAVEYALGGEIQGLCVEGVLDRTFVDEHNVRWIIDYKTTETIPEDLEAFLEEQQQQYASQLRRYGCLMALREQRPIKLGLYFPGLPAWREWEF